jgi:two-component system NarL family sensor kinase
MDIRKKKNSRRLSPRTPSSVLKPRPNAAEAEEIVLAIRRGGIDALVMQGAQGEKVVTLQGTEHPYRVLVESINDGAATLDADGIVLYANSRFAQILNIPVGKLTGSSLHNNLSAGQSDKLKKLIRQALHRSSAAELTLDATEGRPKLVRFTLRPLKDSDIHKVGVVATELTELVEANEALKSNEESLRQLSARLLQLQDEERRHIARDLHDVTGQKLAVLSMALSRVLNRPNGNLDADSQRALTESLAWSKEVAAEIRTLSYLLHPPLLDELGLSSAVKWYLAGFTSRTGILMETEIPSDIQRLSPDAEVAIFRVLQESLTNVHRYAESPNAVVRMDVTADEIKLEIQDFGKGVQSSRASSPNGSVARLGVGIQGMTERMRQLGGKLEITSSPNKGTLVAATIPLSSLAAIPPQSSAVLVSTSSNLASELAGPVQNTLRKRILIADDHEMLRRGVRNTLQTELDLEICGEAVDGQDAVEKVKALQPDLVILDINMPALNGLVALRQILRLRPQTKVLVFSVHDSDQTVKEVHAAGAHGFISKGKDSQDLLRVVREILNVKSLTASASPVPN